MALGLTQPLTAVSTSDISWPGLGLGGGGAVRRAEDINHPHVPIVWKLWEAPIQACNNGTALPFTFVAYCLNNCGYFQDYKLHI
jgi:hypothetical protein